MAISRIGVNRASGGLSRSENLLAEIDRMIISSGTPVESTQASTRRRTTPGRRKFGIPLAQRRHGDRPQYPLGLQVTDDRGGGGTTQRRHRHLWAWHGWPPASWR